MQSSDKWSEEFTKAIGQAIDQARHGKSDQWIADQATAMGHPISRTAVSEYRRGVRKNVPVTDLIVIARVLRVPPIYLLFPNLPEGPSFPFPGQPDTAAVDSMRWFTGESEWASPLPFYAGDTAEIDVIYGTPRGRGFGAAEYNKFGLSPYREPMESDEADLVWLTRSLVRAYRMRDNAVGPSDDQTQTTAINSELWQQAEDQIRDLEKRIEKLGGKFRDSERRDG